MLAGGYQPVPESKSGSDALAGIQKPDVLDIYFDELFPKPANVTDRVLMDITKDLVRNNSLAPYLNSIEEGGFLKNGSTVKQNGQFSTQMNKPKSYFTGAFDKSKKADPVNTYLNQAFPKQDSYLGKITEDVKKGLINNSVNGNGFSDYLNSVKIKTLSNDSMADRRANKLTEQANKANKYIDGVIKQKFTDPMSTILTRNMINNTSVGKYRGLAELSYCGQGN